VPSTSDDDDNLSIEELAASSSTGVKKSVYSKNSCIVLINVYNPELVKPIDNVKCVILIVNWLNEFPITEIISFPTCLLFKNTHQRQCERIIKYENFIALYKGKDIRLVTINDLINMEENYRLDPKSVYVLVLQNSDINYRFFKIFYYSIIFKWMKWGIQIVKPPTCTTKQGGDGLFKILNKQFHNELNSLVKLDIQTMDNNDASGQFTSDLQSVFKCCPVVFDSENNVFKNCDVRFLITTAQELANTVSKDGVLPEKYYNVDSNIPTTVIGGKMWKPSMMTSACLRTVGVNLYYFKRFAPNFTNGICLNTYYTDLLDIHEDTWI